MIRPSATPVSLFKRLRSSLRAVSMLMIVAMLSGATTLTGPARFLPQRLEGEVFYVPVAQGADQRLIKNAKSSGLKINRSFFDKYHAPLVASVRQAARHRDLSVGDQVNLFGWLVIQTHKTNGVGYLWGGDLSDKPGDKWSTSGVGYDCSGFVWSVWEAIAPESVFANGGQRLDSKSYRKFGRQVIPPSTVNEDFIARLRKVAKPGDVLIMPGHICLFGYDPRTEQKTPIVMENGEFWNNLEKWMMRYKGKKYELRSAFAADGRLMINSVRRGRALPPMAPVKPDTSLLVASAEDLKKKAQREDETVLASAAPAQLEEEKDLQKVDEDIRQIMSEVRAFDIDSLPPPSALKSKKNEKPEIVKVMTRAPELVNTSLEFGIATDDKDFDEIVEYRIRMYGAKNWTVSDRPYFKTAIPGYSGEAILEFQVVDARGATSPSSYCKVKIKGAEAS